MVGGKCVAVATNMRVEGGTGGVRSANADEADVLYHLQPRRTAPAILKNSRQEKNDKKSEGSGIHAHQRRPVSTPMADQINAVARDLAIRSVIRILDEGGVTRNVPGSRKPRLAAVADIGGAIRESSRRQFGVGETVPPGERETHFFRSVADAEMAARPPDDSGFVDVLALVTTRAAESELRKHWLRADPSDEIVDEEIRMMVHPGMSVGEFGESIACLTPAIAAVAAGIESVGRTPVEAKALWERSQRRGLEALADHLGMFENCDIGHSIIVGRWRATRFSTPTECRTALMARIAVIIEDGEDPVVEWLLDRGVNPNAPSYTLLTQATWALHGKDGYVANRVTPLMLAAQRHLPKVCKRLIEAGADPLATAQGPVRWRRAARVAPSQHTCARGVSIFEPVHLNTALHFVALGNWCLPGRSTWVAAEEKPAAATKHVGKVGGSDRERLRTRELLIQAGVDAEARNSEGLTAAELHIHLQRHFVKVAAAATKDASGGSGGGGHK